MYKSNPHLSFVLFLQKDGLSENTIKAYVSTVEMFCQRYGDATSSKNLLAFKGFLIEKYKPRTVNQRIQAINRYLVFLDKPELRLKSVKLQEKSFLENVISDADYRFLKSSLFRDHDDDLAMAVWFLAATGARVSELLQFKAEHIHSGYIDLSTKGGKVRRIFIPQHLISVALPWLQKNNIDSGYIFLNQNGVRITARGLAQKLKDAAVRYHLNIKEVHPHSFRHRFAKNFLEKYQDIALLADLMGHDSIETTRIYLRRTATEQQNLVNTIVDW